ncbi:hypothetical protein [Mycobacterium sp. SM3041]|uniref:hypothetical protein n=2 Tax=Mycobacteriaceae TaxID=1762 RepID=UPI0032046D5B
MAALATHNAGAITEAVLLGPLVSTEAQGLLDRAKAIAAQDPAAALILYRDIQSRLVAAGLPGHAAEFDHTIAALCVGAGEEHTAIRLLMDALWAAENADRSLHARRVVGTLRDLAGFDLFTRPGSQSPRTPALGAAFEIADFVSDHLEEVGPTKIKLPDAAMALADTVDRARVMLFAAERALGNDDLAWITTHREQIEAIASEIAHTHVDVAVRLRLAVADATGNWQNLVSSARSTMPQHLRALTLARHARHLLLQARPLEADEAWRDAIVEACQSGRNADAADWLYSQRFVSNRYLGPVEDRWHPLAQTLSDKPTQPRIVSNATDVRERALAALHYDKQRSAAISLRRQLLDGIRSASFYDEREARCLLGEMYRITDELPLAAYYSIGGGDYEEARKVAVAFGDVYHDVTESMKSPLSWVAACAFEFATEQADLIPDGQLDVVVDLALSAVDDAFSGARLDSPVLSPQMYLSAYELIAALAKRLTATHARTLLDMLADKVEVEQHRYRRTDESHVQIAAGIATAQVGELQAVALDQLLGLFARASHDFGPSARNALIRNLDQTRERLQALAADGHREAAALLGYCDPECVSREAADAASQRLCEPTRNGPNGFGIGGTGIVNDSLLAAVLPVETRIACIKMLLSNAASPWEPATNRDSYLIAASNLVANLDDEHRTGFFETAMDFATRPPFSSADADNASMSSPLSAMRINDKSDCRPAATYLAAKLAVSSDEKRRVRDAALRLIGVGSDEDYRIATALERVGTDLRDSIGFLAQGSWPLRRLAAILWADSADIPDELGTALARDADVRVRIASAHALVKAIHRQDSAARDILLNDPRWSVRSLFTDARVNS